MIKGMIETEADEFGIRKIYPTNTNSDCAERWLLGIGNWEARAPGWDGSRSNDNGFLQLKVRKGDGQIRYNVRAIPNSTSVGETDQSKLRNRGFMGMQKDWKNVEMTIYAKINQAEGKKNGGKHFELLCRGGPKHTDSKPCEGTALHANLYVNGRVKLEKELSHTEGYAGNDPQKNNVTENLMQRWIGMKGIFYNMNNGNVKIELWLDKDANSDLGEKPVLEFEDNGSNWKIKNNKNNECNGSKTERITWGGPVVIFRWDNLIDVDLKKVSVREIIAAV
jgi:hypothetical protein